MFKKINPKKIKEDLSQKFKEMIQERATFYGVLYILYLATIFLTPLLIALGWHLGLSLAQ